MNNKLLWGAGGAVALVLIALMAISIAGEQPIDTSAEYGEVTLAGTPLPPYGGDPNSDSAIGMVAPTVSGTGFDGTSVTVAADGRPKMLIFLAHWCPHCQAEVPDVQNWVDTVGVPDNVDLVAITTSTSEVRANFPPSDWLAGEGWTSPVIRDDQANSAATAFGLSAFPYWVILDGEGKVLFRVTGEVDQATLANMFQLASQSA